MTESTTNGEHLALWGGRFKSGRSLDDEIADDTTQKQPAIDPETGRPTTKKDSGHKAAGEGS